MSDDKAKAGKGTVPSAAGKRPHATLDLKATEVKTASTGTDAQTSSGRAAPETAAKPRVTATPLPAPASSYATAPKIETAKADTETSADSAKPAREKQPFASKSSAASSSSSSASGEPATKPVSPPRGGFFTHLGAGVLGGLVAFLGMQWALPELGLDGTLSSRFANDSAAISERIAGLEKRVASQNGPASDLNGIEQRLAALEKTSETIPALKDSQSRLVAETKAALASAASDAGGPQLIERIGQVEQRLKALADVGANDPGAGRVEQFAALNDKVAKLEAQSANASSAVSDAVLKDLDVRIAAAKATGEAAKGDVDRLAENLRRAQSETTRLQSDIDALKTSTAKPADIVAAVTPLSDRVASTEQKLQIFEQSEAARRASAQHVLLSLELQNLKRAIERGGAYTAELNAVKTVAGAGVDLAPLAKLEDTGVPSQSDLSKEFRTAAAAAIDAESAPEENSVVGRLWSEAKSVVRVRRIDHKPDDKSTEATVGRMQIALDDGRFRDVLTAADDLPPAAAEATAPFIEKVSARVSIDEAIAQLESRLKASLASPAPAHSQN